MKQLKAFCKILVTFAFLHSSANAQLSSTSSSDTYRPQIGMIYSIWHCMATTPPNNTVVTEAQSTNKWGLLGNLHWRDIPESSPVANYCINRNPALLDLHFEQFKKSKVDFIVVSLPYFCSLPDSKGTITGCLSIDSDTKKNIDLLMEKAATTSGAPKIVFWLPFRGKLLDYIIAKMKHYPSTNYIHEGAPLIIASWIKDRNFHLVEDKISSLKSQFTIRKMWGMLSKSSPPADGNDLWSSMEACKDDFSKMLGDTSCQQPGTSEMTSVSPAYNETYITEKKTAVPRYGTRTMMRQFETAIARRSKVIIFNSWNEWVDQRLCYNSSELNFDNGKAKCANGVSEFGPNGEAGFISQATREYSRDIEPDKTNNETFRVFQYLVDLAKKGEFVVTPVPDTTPPPSTDPVSPVIPTNPTAPTNPTVPNSNQSSNSGYFAVNSNERGADFRNSYRPDSVYIEGDTVIIGTVTGMARSSGISQMRIFIPPGATRLSIVASAYLANEDARVAVSFRAPPMANHNNITSNNNNYSGKELLSAILEKNEELHFYSPSRSGVIMLLSPGAEKVAPLQEGGWLYLNFLSIPGGNLLNMQTRIVADKNCYLRWYQQAQWDITGNPVEGGSHRCN